MFGAKQKFGLISVIIYTMFIYKSALSATDRKLSISLIIVMVALGETV